MAEGGREKDVEKLAIELRKLSLHEEEEEYSWGKPALDVLDCILSLNRRYEEFVVPRVEKFVERNPEVTSLEDLLQMIIRLGAAQFMEKELDYDHPSRAETLAGVVGYLIGIERKFDGATEQARLENWAIQSKPEDCEKMNVKGFGLAGFQYLRMLFGAQTVKPDIHIKRFVSRVTKRRVTDVQALEYLELAAKRAGLPIRDADYGIWKKSAGAAD